MHHFLIVAAGGALGAGLRHLVNMFAMRTMGIDFPWGTLAVNVVGSFLMGLFIALLAHTLHASNELRLFVATGILGGFTTFSAFSLDVAVLYERGAVMSAGAYAAASLILSIAALFAGLALIRTLA